MREQKEENKSIKRFAYTGPSSKKYDEEATGFVNTPVFGFNQAHQMKKSDPWKDKNSSSLFDMALPTSPRTATTGFYSRYSSYKGGKTDGDLQKKSSPSNSQEFTGSSGISWNQSRAGYSYSHHDPKPTTDLETKRNFQTLNQLSITKKEDTSGSSEQYTGTSYKSRPSASSSWNDL
ncbi:uncharacterized protein [Antedon mediterranea]|uniref:uncharacterized protein n=1 Tax=Antedon mediterranea TaxID=105859 RepID=UPI003AF5C0BA